MIPDKKLSFVLISILVALNVAQLITIRNLKSKNLYNTIALRGEIEAERLAQREFPSSVKLVEVQNNKHKSFYKQIDEKISIVVLFEPTGCGSCLDEKFLWNDIATLKDVNGVSIALHPYKNELKKYTNDSGIKTSVYQDSALFLRDWFKPDRLPVKLLVSNRQVIFVDYVRENAESRKQFMNFITSYLNEYEKK